jgi:zinc protease
VDFYTDYKKTVEAQTPESIMTFMKELLKNGDRAEIIMMPEK